MVVISVDCVLSQNTAFLLFTNFACILVPNLGYIRVEKRVKLGRSRCISFETEEEVWRTKNKHNRLLGAEAATLLRLEIIRQQFQKKIASSEFHATRRRHIPPASFRFKRRVIPRQERYKAYHISR
jgi:hypothetical protein